MKFRRRPHMLARDRQPRADESDCLKKRAANRQADKSMYHGDLCLASIIDELGPKRSITLRRMSLHAAPSPMRSFGTLLLFLGLLVGVIGGAGLMAGLHVTGWTWFVAIGLAKLTLIASGGLMAGGAILQRLARREDEHRLLQSQRDTTVE